MERANLVVVPRVKYDMRTPQLAFCLTLALGTGLGLRCFAIAKHQQKQGDELVIIPPEKLPEPFATSSANNGPRMKARQIGQTPKVPDGFKVELWTADASGIRTLALAPNGDVFAAGSFNNSILVYRSVEGKLEKHTFATDCDLPFGIAFQGDFLYIGNTNKIVRYAYKSGQLMASGSPEVVYSDIPGRGYNQHWTRNILFSKDGKKLYLSVGSGSNVGEEPFPRASIVEIDCSTWKGEPYATGIRNAVSTAWDPVTGKLWTCCNERDGLGDDVPPDFVTSVQKGGFYGWPYSYIGKNPDPRMKDNPHPEMVEKAIVPDAVLGAHTAAVGVMFYTAKEFGKDYENDLFVSLHGSWNRSKRMGYMVVHIPMKNGKPEGIAKPFMSGLVNDDDTVWGRPVGLLQLKDGSMLVVDDGSGAIWRISREKPTR